jgi:type 1 glutamine amidotransferase
MSRRALITWGGWDGHEPRKVADLFKGILEEDGMQVEVHDDLSCLADADYLRGLDLIAPVWTMSKIEPDFAVNVSEAVARGTGIAGCHGGMCDAFRENVLWQFMTGGNWVAHPGGDGVDYRVIITDPDDPLTEGIGDFDVSSEQYYLHVDPTVEVLATTEFPSVHWYHSSNGRVDMPVAWTKRWGLGRVYYNSLGHQANVINHGAALEMIRRGLIWASHGRQAALANGERFEDYVAEGKHY